MQGLSIACSTPEAVSWDPSWANSHEISGRAMKNVHDAAEGFQYERRQERKEQRAADDCVGESTSIHTSMSSISTTGALHCQCVKSSHAIHAAVIHIVQRVGLSCCSLLTATSVAAIDFRAECVSTCADNPDGPMQHRSANGIANGVANGVTHGGFDAEAGKVAATATKQVVQGLRATAAAFTPGKQVPATAATPSSSKVASVSDC